MKFDVYIDSDGVICNFDLYCLTHLGRYAHEFPTKGAFWAAFSRHNDTVQPVYRNLPKHLDADRLVQFCVDNFASTRVLTACGYTPKDAAQQKIDWYAELYPRIECIVVPKSQDKAAYAAWNTILIDDRAKSIDPWVAAGGIGILHRSVDQTIDELRSYIGE